MRQLSVVAKYWQPGTVKTRLAASVGNQAAANLQRVFVETLAYRMRGIAARCVFVCTPEDRCEEFRELAGDPWSVEAQCAGDLGERLQHHLAKAFEDGVEQAILIGADSPTVPVSYVQQAFVLLSHHDVVLGPANDGGYYLLGAGRTVPPIFQGVSWGTERVWQETVEGLEKAGISWTTIGPWYDVDELPGLRRLYDELLEDRSTDPIRRRLTDTVEHAISLADDAKTL